MTLANAVTAGLAAVSGPGEKFRLDDRNRCVIPVPMPAAITRLVDEQLEVIVEVAGSGAFFSMYTPLAGINVELSAAFADALLRRQFTADQLSGLSFGIGGAEDVLVAVYHWVLPSITPEDFTELLQRFITAALGLIDEVNSMATRAPDVTPLHDGRNRPS